MSDSLGARLRRRREEQGIALVTIADETKIKVSLLEALERDDVTQWPSGIFRRAFIRAYAQAIGLNPDAIVREFLDAYPDPEETAAVAARAQAAERAEANASAGRFRHLMGSALGSLSRLRRSPAPNVSPDASVGRDEIAVVTVSREAPAAVERSTTEEVALGQTADAVVAVATPGHDVHVPPPLPEAPVAAADPLPPTLPPSRDVDYAAVAQLCTAFARVDSADQAQALLGEVARLLDAAGVIVWITDDVAGELRPALSYGYSPRVLAQVPSVRVSDDNVTAAAFRTSDVRAVPGSAQSSGALAVPLPSPAGCAGVLALELEHGAEAAPSVRAAATILAALVGQLVGDRVREVEAEVPPALIAAAPIPFRAMARR